jgi:uncharacterized protein (DUF1800 family)
VKHMATRELRGRRRHGAGEGTEKGGAGKHAAGKGRGKHAAGKGKGKHEGAAGKPREHRLHRPTPPGGSSSGAIGPSTPMSAAMVDRLFWRAGFGPSAQDRARWTGRPLGDAVDWLLGTPEGTAGVPGTDDGSPLDPTGNDTDLVLSWVDVMIRATNPFVERLTFFWHRHWANSRESVSPPQLLMTQTNLFRSYADFAANPKASFKDMAYAISIDPSMLRYLTGESNVKGAPNENYGRELMELFTLGVLNAKGQPNYSQTDVEQMAKALSGWQINDTNPNAVFSFFTQSNWYDGPKLIFGQFGNYNTTGAVDLVIAHPAHPAFIVGELWSEFVVSPPDAATLQSLIKTYTGNDYQLKPLLRQILTSATLFESIGEPNMIKSPVVYVVGVMRALGAEISDSTASDYLDAQGQQPYFPPNVSGWEGGLSWLNTDTALARFDFVATLLGKQKLTDVPGETPQAAYDRAYSAVGEPWLAAGTQAAILDLAQTAQASTPDKRIQRQIALRALMLAGPDAQVM